jgi:2-polyprenyl-3-methyl-5-hydroxy-6-metoxy-1,4-benzoquinol methylase
MVERVFRATSGAMELFTMYLGDQLGFYEALAKHGPQTVSQLARRTGTAERYVREWLEQQCVVGILAVEDAGAPESSRRFYLPAGHDEVLTDRESLNYMVPLAQLTAGVVVPLQSVLRAFREGTGVPYGEYGRDVREGQARMNRPAFLKLLGQEWLPAVPGLRRRLESQPPARIADFGCGAGWSSIGIAKMHPLVRVDGFDLDEPSIALARANAVETGVADRVNFSVQDAASPELEGQYDVVIALECLHDMSDPVGALRTMRRMARQDGTVLIVDERVAERFDPNTGGLEWLMYGCSVLHCLPVGMAEPPAVGTGTVMRTATLEHYARQAGFSKVDVLPVDYPLFRFYHLQ